MREGQLVTCADRFLEPIPAALGSAKSSGNFATHAAIEAHASRGSEANQVIALFNALSAQQQQDLLNFLRSL